MHDPDSIRPAPATGLRKYVFLVLGGLCCVLGGLGVLLPGLPTTPFLLLASYFFVRVSPRLNNALLRSRLFGPILLDWQQRGGVRLAVKLQAVTVVVLVVGLTLCFSTLHDGLKLGVVALALIGILVVLRLPEVRDGAAADNEDTNEDSTPAADDPKNTLRYRVVQMACDISNKLRGVSEISAEELSTTDPSRIRLIDVRPAEERAVSIIPGAETIDQFESTPRAADDQRLIVPYCTAGYRSGVFAQKLQKRGETEVRNLRGGILLWCHAGQPLQTEDGRPTSRVHVYAKQWNLVPDGYEGVW